MAFKSDIEIAREAKMLPITEIAKELGIGEEDLDCYGRYKAKLTGDTRVVAAVYGGGKHEWPLRLVCDFIKKEGVWKMTKSVASTY